MAPKTNCNELKLTQLAKWFQTSRTAWNIKDLEKQIPKIASINGMQVKDYLQALQDDNKILVEKIGSGNWYWSFASQDKATRQKAFDTAKDAHDKAEAVVEELKLKARELQAQRADEEEKLDIESESREDLIAKKAALEAEVKGLEKALSAYSDNDPTELEKKRKESENLKMETMQYTEEIESMQRWFKESMGGDPEQLKRLLEDYFEGEWDEEEGGLRELF